MTVSALECPPGATAGESGFVDHLWCSRQTSKEEVTSHFTNGQADPQTDGVLH